MRDKVESATDPDARLYKKATADKAVPSYQGHSLIEKVFGWSKLDRPLRQVKLRGLDRVDWFYRLTIAVYNLVRIKKLIPIQSVAA